MQPIQADVYDYVIFFENVPNSGVPQVKNLVIQSDADFECQSTQCALMSDMTAPQTVDTVDGEHFVDMYLDIENTGNGQRWSNIPIAITTLFGTGCNVFMLPVSYIMERNANFKLTLTSFAFAAIPRVTFVFSGRKLLK